MPTRPRRAAAVIGGGSFGTVLANQLARNGCRVTLWLRDEAVATAINRQRRNPRYLPRFRLHRGMRAVTDLDAALDGAEAVVMAVPCAATRSVAERMAARWTDGMPVISTAKGFEAKRFLRMSEVLAETLPTARIAALSGPNFAGEIASKHPTGTVVASTSPALIALAREMFDSKHFRVYGAQDVCGVELAGALKNIYAIIAGIAGAFQLGNNSTGMLVSRALAEMSRFGARFGAEPATFSGLSGVGDLLASCMSPQSRNYRIGYAFGEGMTVEEAHGRIGGQTAEGVGALPVVWRRARELGVSMPLVNGLHDVLFSGRAIAEAVNRFMLTDAPDDVGAAL